MSGGYGQAGAGLEERIYAIHGPNGNVTAITDATGQVLERFIYDPLGNFQVLTPLSLSRLKLELLPQIAEMARRTSSGAARPTLW